MKYKTKPIRITRKHRRRLYTLLLLCLMAPLSHSREVLLPSGWRFDFVTDLSEGTAVGAISSVTDPQGKTVFNSTGDPGLFDWTAGIQRPTLVGIETSDESARIDLSGFRTTQGAFLPLKATVYINGNESELFFEAVLTTPSTCRLDRGVGILIPVDASPQVNFFNTMGRLENNIIPLTLSEPFRLPFQNRIVIRSGLGSLQINLRNPLLPVPARSSDGVILEFLSWYPPVSTNPEGLKNLCSILAPGDTVRVEWSLTSIPDGDRQKSIAVFTPHPRGGDCSAYLAFDDIPSLEPEWAVPTDPNNHATPVTSRWLKILDQFPDVQFTWLILFDGIQRLGNWHFPGWWPPTRNVYPDSSVVYAGGHSCRMSLSPEEGETAVITQVYPVTVGDTYRFDIMISGQYAQEIPAIDLRVKSWRPAYSITDTTYPVENGRWTPASIEFVSDSVGTISISISARGATGQIYLDEGSLTNLRTGENIQEGGGFEQYQPFIYYDPPDSMWHNARSILNIANEAPQSYRDWLKIVQDGSSEWRYTRQVALGLHGLHHTPDTLFATQVTHTHEFNYFDPIGDSIRMKRIADEITESGLDTNQIMAFFRFPGHRHTESLLKPILDHGVRMIDQGNFVDRFCAGFLMRYHLRVWVTSSVSWHDKFIDVHVRHLESSLNAGMFSLMGCHYNAMNSADTPGERERTVEFFDWMEQTYPNLVWIKGTEIADLWDELGRIRNIRQQGYSDRITLTWNGASTLGESVMIYLPFADDNPVLCSLDGQIIDSKRIGPRFFIVLPTLNDASHRLDVAVIEEPPMVNDPKSWQIVREEESSFTLSRFNPQRSQIDVAIFDAAGRKIHDDYHFDFTPGKQAFRVTTPVSPSGIYFARIVEGGEISTVRLPRIR